MPIPVKYLTVAIAPVKKVAGGIMDEFVFLETLHNPLTGQKTGKLIKLHQSISRILGSFT